LPVTRTGLSQLFSVRHCGEFWRSLMRPNRNVLPEYSLSAASIPRLATSSLVLNQNAE
jgi:hypothetical protein